VVIPFPTLGKKVAELLQLYGLTASLSMDLPGTAPCGEVSRLVSSARPVGAQDQSPPLSVLVPSDCPMPQSRWQRTLSADERLLLLVMGFVLNHPVEGA